MVFNETSGKYENPDAISTAPVLTDDEREGVKLATERDEHQSTVNSLNTILDMSQGMLDNAIQAKAEYDVEKQLIRDDDSLNDVQKGAAFAVLENKSRTLDVSLELAQKAVADDTNVVRKANAALITSKSAHDAHLSKMHNTPTAAELEQMKSIPRTKLTVEQKTAIVNRMGFDFYSSIPMI